MNTARTTRRRGLVTFAAGVGLIGGSAGVAVAATAARSIPDGEYSAILDSRFPSAEVEFHVTDHGTRIPHLTLYCHSDQTLYNGGAAAQVSVSTGALRIRDGAVRDAGREANVRPGGIHTVAATAPVHLTLHHVDGPVVHYTVKGRRVHLPTAWTGSVSSPACTRIADGGRVTLYGPVPATENLIASAQTVR